jgi:HPr kinase/phosphorylase
MPSRRRPLAILVDLVVSADAEHLPENCFEEVPKLPIPTIALAAFEVSAPAKLQLARYAFPAPLSPAILR